MSIKTASRLDSINEYYFSKKLKEIAALNLAGKNIISFGIGSPDLPPSEKTINALIEAAQKPTSHGYQSYVGIPALREAFAGFYNKYYAVKLNPVNEILPLLGSKEGIMHVCMTYLEAGDQALIPNPGYPTYRAAVTLTGAECINYDLAEANNWLPDFATLEKTDLSRVKLMFVNYPHMPTGAQATRKAFEDIVSFAKKHQILIINDNPYSFILNKTPLSILSVEGAMDVALELNSLSKSSNMAGWRIGALVGRADYLSDVLRFKSNMDSGMFLPLQVAAVEALQADTDWYADLNKIYAERQQKAFELLNLLGCTYDNKQQGLFVWAKTPPQYPTGFELSDEILYGANVFITPGGIFGSGGDAYVRVSLCAKVAVFEAGIQRVEDFYYKK
ncbi:MAG: aminotransferase class I/II-fold pyridoxal phosphate-dependent enzyme [Saprospiraceae bacterium]|nr:aminotransferase class I/II-fold pyridoxal phosphate-dependent enzyme [Saprospiraceae bacterium]